MSMTVEIKVNGELVHQLYIVNRGESDRADLIPDERLYQWECDLGTVQGVVAHRRNDGALALVAVVAGLAHRAMGGS